MMPAIESIAKIMSSVMHLTVRHFYTVWSCCMFVHNA